VGAALERFAPALETTGPQLLVWGFVVSTVAVWHATFAINSLAHALGRRRFDTRDDSRNNFGLALLTFGEGWHNNHHRYPSSVRQGLYWWEIDLTYYALRALAAFGLVWDLRAAPSPGRPAAAGEVP
jgi:stearoyl-CoA desaturase (delta-9 desaturase)